jgi:hypothetical protein
MRDIRNIFFILDMIYVIRVRVSVLANITFE